MFTQPVIGFAKRLPGVPWYRCSTCLLCLCFVCSHMSLQPAQFKSKEGTGSSSVACANQRRNGNLLQHGFGGASSVLGVYIEFTQGLQTNVKKSGLDVGLFNFADPGIPSTKTHIPRNSAPLRLQHGLHKVFGQPGVVPRCCANSRQIVYIGFGLDETERIFYSSREQEFFEVNK